MNEEAFQQKPSHSKPFAISSCLKELKKNWKRQGRLTSLLDDWSKIAGPLISNQCSPIKIRNGILFIGANHPHWRQALIYNRTQLLAALRAAGYDIKDLRVQQFHQEPIKKIESQLSIWARHPSRIDVHGITECKECRSPSPTGELALWGKCGFCRRKDLIES